MLTVSSAYFNSVFPELASTPAATVDALNAPCRVYVSEAKFGDSGQYALALVIAHNIALGMTKGGGPVTSERVGDVSVGYAALPTTTAMHMTSYGQRFLELARMLSIPIVTDGMSGAILPQPFGGLQPTWPDRPPGNGYTWGA